MDKATEQQRRIHFSRVCVEVDCGAELPDAILVDIEEVGAVEISVEYPSKSLMCTMCKACGHSNQFCKVPEHWLPKTAAQNAGPPSESTAA